MARSALSGASRPRSKTEDSTPDDRRAGEVDGTTRGKTFSTAEGEAKATPAKAKE
jgi:hypothetical protein